MSDRLVRSRWAALLAVAAFHPVFAGTPVNVLYAGSLVETMEHGVGPAFDAASGDRFRGYAGGSKLLANQIRSGLRAADVFISAVPGVNRRLMGPGAAGSVRWYATFAQSPLVIGYDAKSRYAQAFRAEPWYQVLQAPGIRLGRTDPKLDPKGALTLRLMQRAEAVYRLPGLERRVLGDPENPAQVLPEEVLVGRLQSGQVDAGFFYSTETAAAHIPTVRLPTTVAPTARYTVTILRAAPHPAAALAFVRFLLGPGGRRILERNGLQLRKPAFTGDPRAVPGALRRLLGTPE
jgi:molybdate/tungstate transport system substrate-binding protein